MPSSALVTAADVKVSAKANMTAEDVRSMRADMGGHGVRRFRTRVCRRSTPHFFREPKTDKGVLAPVQSGRRSVDFAARHEEVDGRDKPRHDRVEHHQRRVLPNMFADRIE